MQRHFIKQITDEVQAIRAKGGKHVRITFLKSDPKPKVLSIREFFIRDKSEYYHGTFRADGSISRRILSGLATEQADTVRVECVESDDRPNEDYQFEKS